MCFQRNGVTLSLQNVLQAHKIDLSDMIVIKRIIRLLAVPSDFYEMCISEQT